MNAVILRVYLATLVIPKFMHITLASTVVGNSKQNKKTASSVLHGTDSHEHPMEEARKYELTPEEMLHDHIVNQVTEGVGHAIHEFEKFSQKNNLGLSLGDEKGRLIEQVISEFLKAMGDPEEPVNVLEMGSHIGDGSLRIVNQIKTRPKSNLVAIEPDNHWHTIGPKIVRHAVRSDDAVDNSIYHPFSFPHDLMDFADTLANTHGIKKFHIVFMDHGDHSSFKNDLEALIKAGALAPGAKIVADNAKTKASEKADYFDFVKNSGHFAASETIPISAPYKDAVHVATFKGRLKDEL